MRNLYLTADVVGMDSGGGKVTAREWGFFNELHNNCVHVPWLMSRGVLLNAESKEQDPWCWDDIASRQIGAWIDAGEKFKHCHIYAGTFSRSVQLLKLYGCKVTYTAAAHDIDTSRKAYEDLGIPYNYPHLTVPELWERYKQGYMLADALIVPSTHSKSVMEKYGYKGRIEVIPHGVDLPEKVNSRIPKVFTVGYLGAIGPDKGLKYLLQAWKQLAYPDAVLKIAGKESTNLMVQHMLQTYGGGNVQLLGWVKSLKEFYESLSLYVQPSVSEGFGCEVTEAMAHGTPVLCSLGAGASDHMMSNTFPAGDVSVMMSKIDHIKNHLKDDKPVEKSEFWRMFVSDITWEKIGKRYIDFWKEVIR